mmetsp:Transcript_62227/g.148475  ORF Transcript_62227/g.148475 Transcript_62227/m.148475 type:complete len:344 (+) Transcript_62227:201-1232(+)
MVNMASSDSSRTGAVWAQVIGKQVEPQQASYHVPDEPKARDFNTAMEAQMRQDGGCSNSIHRDTPQETSGGASAWLNGSQPKSNNDNDPTDGTDSPDSALSEGSSPELDNEDQAEHAPESKITEKTTALPQPLPQQMQTGGQQLLPPAQNTKPEDIHVIGLGVTLDYLQGMARQSGTMGQLSRFHCVREPQLPLKAYLSRLRTFFLCSTECYVLALVYIDRLVQRHPEIVVSPLSSHRLLISALTLAAKFNDDTFYSNSYYAKVGGLRVEELNALEKTFLRLIDWKLHVKPEEFGLYQAMVKDAALKFMKAARSQNDFVAKAEALRGKPLTCGNNAEAAAAHA